MFIHEILLFLIITVNGNNDPDQSPGCLEPINRIISDLLQNCHHSATLTKGWGTTTSAGTQTVVGLDRGATTHNRSILDGNTVMCQLVLSATLGMKVSKIWLFSGNCCVILRKRPWCDRLTHAKCLKLPRPSLSHLPQYSQFIFLWGQNVYYYFREAPIAQITQLSGADTPRGKCYIHIVTVIFQDGKYLTVR